MIVSTASVTRRERRNQSDDLRPARRARPGHSVGPWTQDKMATAVVTLGVLCVVGLAGAAPATTFDQRQHGEINIHAQLDNIVILLIPASKINLMEVSPASENNLTQDKPDKNGFLQFLQKHIKNDIDRYDVVNEDDDLASSPQNVNEVLSSQRVDLNQKKEKEDKEKEEEVVATVEEMKPDTKLTEKTTLPAKPEATEDTIIKEHPNLGESVQETVFKVSVPEELKDAVEKAEKDVKKSEKDKELNKVSEKAEKASSEIVKQVFVQEKVAVGPKKEQTQVKKDESQLKKKEQSSPAKEDVPTADPLRVPSQSSSALDELIKPVAAKTPESAVAVAGSRREKVIRYKPEAKWAPGLVELMGPVRSRGLQAEEKQRYGPLCSPGHWDSELQTCIMPGDHRSRNELARFLEAMRFGIALPAQ